MNANWQSYIVRSIQKAMVDAAAFTAGTPSDGVYKVFFDGMRVNPEDYTTFVAHNIGDVRWQPSRARFRMGTVGVTLNCISDTSTDIHRIDEIVGAAMAVYDRVSLAIMDYPAASPVQIGWIRFTEADVTSTVVQENITGETGGGAVQIDQRNIAFTGRIEIDT